jgi:hypothetical protein
MRRAAETPASLAYARNVWREALARNPDDPHAPLYRRALEDVERQIRMLERSR